MDCLQAQQVISAALDREPVDAAQLAEAKQHCRECAECARFIQGLAAVQRAGIPQPPAGLAEAAAAHARSVVERERERSANAKAAAAAALAAAAATAAGAGAQTVNGAAVEAAAGTSADAAPDASPAPNPSAYTAPTTRPPTRSKTTTWIALGAAAAVIVLLVGGAALWGARAMMGPGTAKVATMNETAPTTQQFDTAPAPEAGSAAPSAPSADSVAYVELAGAVYRYTGASTEPTAGLASGGTVTTSLNTGQAPVARTAYRSGGSAAIIVDGPDGGMAFSPVTIQYAGRTYTMRSSAIPAFGVWPTLPSSIKQPANSDGTPTFAIESSSGSTTVYRLNGGSSASGIAYGPNAPESGGNPNWTWWTP